MAHPLFGPEVRLMLEENDEVAMAELCNALHPATVAESLAEGLTVEEVWRILGHTTIETQAAIFEYFPLERQVELVEGTGRQHMARLIEEMSHDDRADLLRRLPRPVADSLLRLVDEADRRDIATLAQYAEGTAGALMTTDYAWLPDNITIGESLDRLRLQAPDTETIYYIYILNDQRKLLGVVSLRDLILKPRQAVIRDIMSEQVVTVNVKDDREKVAQEMARYDLLAIPVVDDDRRLVGIVTYDDAIDVVVSEATEDVHRMGGVGPLETNYLEASFFLVWRRRAVWLAMLFVAELFTFSALAHFEDSIAQVVVLSLFVPLCISTGGNSGSQAATLITRAMALGEVTGRDTLRVLRHEVVMGIILGITLGTIGFLRASLTPTDVRSSSPPRPDPFRVTVDKEMQWHKETKKVLFEADKQVVHVIVPAGADQVIVNKKDAEITLPDNEELAEPRQKNGKLIYEFPAGCSVPRPPVDRWRLALVIGFAVAGICLWGTLIGSMLPIIFKRLGADPAMASSPFVATFVDVTGIVIYFNIARVVLSDFLA